MVQSSSTSLSTFHFLYVGRPNHNENKSNIKMLIQKLRIDHHILSTIMPPTSFGGVFRVQYMKPFDLPICTRSSTFQQQRLFLAPTVHVISFAYKRIKSQPPKPPKHKTHQQESVGFGISDRSSSVTSTAPLSRPFWMVALCHTVTRALPFRRHETVFGCLGEPSYKSLNSIQSMFLII
ncbi:hypothetical protein Ppro_2373 [Pelobacter propionicus DSM 2379]|uniref:Uncharacterized protein n=1 Tax=Pelobacter propionicus (strain DSM 2379 / NBRC 103807 / OttBd1) TaxID=338966 RepID=A1ARK9_PELPD|nr:hypothetical protein Ppro_2373 [Pelobacter propionicus DSM 2379]